MEITELDSKINDNHDELLRHQKKAKKFKEYVQGLFIDLYTQDEFNRRVDAIFAKKSAGFYYFQNKCVE